ncbi:MAG: substrate-binding domain-containing protein [Caulobacteraceae bacterium]
MKSVLAFALCLASTTFARAETLHIYGPGGPAPAVKEAATAFAAATGVDVQVTAGPTPQWAQAAQLDADVIFSGSETMMTGFIRQMPEIDPTSAQPLYLRRAAILVRPGNPMHIRSLSDLVRPGHHILVVDGAGQDGLWEDVAGRLGDIATLKAMRSQILTYAKTSAEAKAVWVANPQLDVWLTWNIWGVANSKLADVVEIEPQYGIWRDAGVALTWRGEEKPQARAFAKFLASPQGAAIFAKWGWRP